VGSEAADNMSEEQPAPPPKDHETTVAIASVGPRELAQWLESYPDLKVLDVRTPYERGLAFIRGSSLLTERLLNEILSDWSKDFPIVAYCHHGIRSLEAVRFLNGHGFRRVYNLSEGIDGWSVDVDPAVPRY
jgi:rhodanese-related sulfurtransferase